MKVRYSITSNTGYHIGSIVVAATERGTLDVTVQEIPSESVRVTVNGRPVHVGAEFPVPAVPIVY